MNCVPYFKVWYLKTEKYNLTFYIIKKWKNEITINPNINSEILEVTLDQLKNVNDLLESNKEIIPYIIDFLK